MSELLREIVIEATPETIWPFLTDPARHVEWMGTSAELDPRPGGTYHVVVAGEFDAVGRFVEVVPHERLVFTFGWTQERALPPGSSTVEITLEPEGDKTRVRLVHRGLPDDDAVAAHGEGWAHYLGRLGSAATGEHPGPDNRMASTDPLDPITAHERALDLTEAIVARIESAQLGATTPCPQLDVRALLDHLIAGNHRFVDIAAGAAGADVPAAGGLVGDDAPLEAYRRSAEALRDAWRDPATQAITVRLPFGEVPGSFALGIHTVEVLVHGWDLATATGQPTEMDADLCELALQHCAVIDDSFRVDGDPFGPPVSVPADASSTDRLVAWLGRQP